MSTKQATAVAQSLHTAGTLDDNPVVKALNSPGDLPSLPTVLTEIQHIINDPKSSGADLREVVERDPAMTANVLKLINSAYYAIPGGVSNLQRAIAFLGYDAIYQVALTVSIMKSFKITDFPNFKLSSFWIHSLGVAAWSEEISKSMKHARPSDCFTAGLLHDLGKLFIAKEDTDTMLAIVAETYKNKSTFSEAEMNHSPLPHTIIGERLCQHWKLPKTIAHAMRWHHVDDPSKRQGVDPQDGQIIDIVILANRMTHAYQLGSSGYPSRKEDTKINIKRLLLKENQMQLIKNKVDQKMKAAEAFLALL